MTIGALVFLTTGYLDRPQPFWWDELARLILLGTCPQRFEVVVRRQTLQIDFGAEPAARKDGSTPATSLTRRRAALWTLREALRPLKEEERRLIMLKLQSIQPSPDDGASLGRAMTGEEVRALVTDGLVTIGAHTVSHPVLSGPGAAACYHEIRESKLACEALIEAPVLGFAYPYGDFDAGAREAVKAAGFAFACSVRRGPAVATQDIFALPRIYVPNLGGDAFELALRSASIGD